MSTKTYVWRKLIAAVILLMSTKGAVAENAVEAAIQFVSALPADGVYDNGYRNRTDISLFSEGGQSRMLPATYLKFFNRTWETFLSQPGLSSEQQKPHHYKVGFELEGNVLTVLIQGLLLPRIEDGEVTGLMRVTLGPSMRLRYQFESGELIEKKLLK